MKKYSFRLSIKWLIAWLGGIVVVSPIVGRYHLFVESKYYYTIDKKYLQEIQDKKIKSKYDLYKYTKLGIPLIVPE